MLITSLSFLGGTRRRIQERTKRVAPVLVSSIAALNDYARITRDAFTRAAGSHVVGALRRGTLVADGARRKKTMPTEVITSDRKQ